ncbi:hypothetical protein QTP88_015153 [Uroleucon formosanum]
MAPKNTSTDDVELLKRDLNSSHTSLPATYGQLSDGREDKQQTDKRYDVCRRVQKNNGESASVTKVSKEEAHDGKTQITYLSTHILHPVWFSPEYAYIADWRRGLGEVFDNNAWYNEYCPLNVLETILFDCLLLSMDISEVYNKYGNRTKNSDLILVA